jgi:hypothetical protein
MKALNIFIYVLSVLVGVAFAMVAIILVASVTGIHVWLLRSAGILLLGVVVLHCFPLTWLTKRPQLLIYLFLAIVTTWGFGALYFFAEVDDPVRGENELFSNAPFRLAFLLSILPSVRALLRLRAVSPGGYVAPEKPL